MVWWGKAPLGLAWTLARQCLVWLCLVRHGSWLGTAMFGLVWQGLRHGMAVQGTAVHGSRQGALRRGQARSGMAAVGVTTSTAFAILSAKGFVEND